MKKFIALFLAILMLSVLGGCQKPVDSPSTAPTNAPSVAPTDEAGITCTFTINASLAVKNESLDKDIVDLLNDDGMLANALSFTVKKGSNAGDAFKDFCKQNNIVLNSEDGQYGLFVKGIGGLDSGACGEMSYWLLKVNGEFSDVGADSIIINDGDAFEWVFTCDGGPDVGYNWMTE